jgi:hypothetical protein
MTTMYDSIHVAEIPRDAEAVAGYIGGKWPTYGELVQKFPKAHRLSIAVASHFDAECLDIEPFDATNAVAAGWVKRQQQRGVKRPVVYTSVSNAHALLATLSEAGISRRDVRLWTAHYTHNPHLCGPRCGFGMTTTADATQYTNTVQGRTLDASLCNAGFFANRESAIAARKRRSWNARQRADQREAASLGNRLKVLRGRIAKRVRLLRRKK